MWGQYIVQQLASQFLPISCRALTEHTHRLTTKKDGIPKRSEVDCLLILWIRLRVGQNTFCLWIQQSNGIASKVKS
jgi:hypothetical protein